MPEINVQDEQGNTHVFPDGSTPEMIAKAMGVKPPSAALVPYSSTNKPNASVSAAPKPFTLPWLKSKFYTAADATADSLPAAGATIGAGIGATGGTFTEPGGGTFLGGVGGAGLGGMAGSAGKHLIRSVLGFDKPADTSTNDIANDISREGVIQGAIEAGSAGLARIAPWLKGTAIGQYERALAPTTKINKAIAADIAPKMVQRGIHGSLESIEDQAGEQAANLRPQLDQAYDDLTRQRVLPPIKGLLPPAPVDVPLANPANASKSVGGVYQAGRPTIPDSAFSTESKLARGDSMAAPVTITDAASPDAPYKYFSTSPRAGTEVPELPETSGGGVLRTSDPAIANRAGLPQEAPTAIKGSPTAPIPAAQIPRPSVLPGSGSKIVSDLENLKGRYIVNGAPANPTAVNAISNVQDIVKQYGNDISPNSLRKLKQIFDDPVAAKGGYAGADLTTQYSVKAQKAAANSIRQIVHQASPDIAALDKEISFWLNVQKVTGASALRRTGQEGGLLKSLAPLASAAAGGGALAQLAGGGTAHTLEGATGAFLAAHAAAAMRSPAWRTASAVLKDRFADALASGNVGKVLALSARFGVAAPGVIQNPEQPSH
jgi:hypothetical protein